MPVPGEGKIRQGVPNIREPNKDGSSLKASEDLKHPCDDEASLWRDCIDDHLKDKNIFSECESQKVYFDRCVTRWREKVGPDIKIKGTHPGEPPPQCFGMSLLVGKCVSNTNYNFEICARPMTLFNHCVKSLYGSEYVVD